MMEDLKPCPFCGSEANVDFWRATGEYAVTCPGCGASPLPFDTEEEAIAAWNRRVEELNRYRKAGNNLAIAAMKVINEYDGIHRLALAVKDWVGAVADEGGRYNLKEGDE